MQVLNKVLLKDQMNSFKGRLANKMAAKGYVRPLFYWNYLDYIMALLMRPINKWSAEKKNLNFSLYKEMCDYFNA